MENALRQRSLDRSAKSFLLCATSEANDPYTTTSPAAAASKSAPRRPACSMRSSVVNRR
jgi:hypothetical protein